MPDYKRKYKFRSGIQKREGTMLWLFLIIGLALGAAIVYFF